MVASTSVLVSDAVMALRVPVGSDSSRIQLALAMISKVSSRAMIVSASRPSALRWKSASMAPKKRVPNAVSREFIEIGGSERGSTWAGSVSGSVSSPGNTSRSASTMIGRPELKS